MERPGEEEKSNCACHRCPTYQQGALEGRFFCVEGSADPRPEELGCLCRTCPVYIKHHYDAEGHFYCRRGAAFV